MACSILFGDTRALSNKYKLYKHINAAFTTYRSGVQYTSLKINWFNFHHSAACPTHPLPPRPPPATPSRFIHSWINFISSPVCWPSCLLLHFTHMPYLVVTNIWCITLVLSLARCFFLVWPWQRSECHSTVAAFCSGANLAPQDHSDAINYTGEKQAGIFISSTHLVHKSINIDRIAIKNEQHLPSTVICSWKKMT